MVEINRRKFVELLYEVSPYLGIREEEIKDL
jgi:hypothetical protein